MLGGRKSINDRRSLWADPAVSVALLVITDGRDEYLDQCVPSLVENVYGPITERWMFDDTGRDA